MISLCTATLWGQHFRSPSVAWENALLLPYRVETLVTSVSARCASVPYPANSCFKSFRCCKNLPAWPSRTCLRGPQGLACMHSRTCLRGPQGNVPCWLRRKSGEWLNLIVLLYIVPCSLYRKLTSEVLKKNPHYNWYFFLLLWVPGQRWEISTLLHVHAWCNYK